MNYANSEQKQVERDVIELQELLVGHLDWSPELWKQAHDHLDAIVDAREAKEMVDIGLGDDAFPMPRTKDECLEEFRYHPPSTLIAAFDAVHRNG